MLNLKEIKALIKLCRSQGIKVVKYGDIELTLGEAPEKPSKAKLESPSDYTTDVPTAEEMLMWSVQDMPGGVANEDN